MNWPDNPWQHLEPPDTDGRITSRRVDPDHRWDFYWARTKFNHLLVLSHGQAFETDRRMPNFKGFKVTNVVSAARRGSLLMFELLEAEHQEIFQRLCQDIVESTNTSPDEKTAVETALGRTWRWHHLLRGGTDDRLSIEEQRGLVGELMTIIDVLEPLVGIKSAIDAWTGPSGAPKDYELGPVAIEHKARRSGSRPEIQIASEHQLDIQEASYLYLVVRDVDQAPPESHGALTLPRYIDRVCSLIGNQPRVEQDLNSRLAALGYRRTDDYSDTSWIVGKRRIYHVGEAFPRIVGGDLPAGVSGVKYILAMKAIGQYEVTTERLEIPHHADQH